MSFWKDRRVLVTGGAGFIGTNLVMRLVALGAKLRVVDSLERGRAENLAPLLDRIEFQQIDLRHQKACLAACKDIAVVFHLASRVGSSDYYSKYPADVLIENILMDTQILEAARGSRVERYFYASSVFVYPRELQQSLSLSLLKEENAIPANPPLSYGWAKLLGEQAVTYAVAQDTNFRGAMLRLMNAYGLYQDIDLERGSIIPVLVRRAIAYPKSKPFIINSSGQETRSYCYISDVVDAILLAIEKLDEHKLIGPLNIGSQEQIRIIDLAKMIIEISGKDIELVTSPSEAVVKGQLLDCSKARHWLDGWQPKVSLEEGLKRTFVYIEDQLTREEKI